MKKKFLICLTTILCLISLTLTNFSATANEIIQTNNDAILRKHAITFYQIKNYEEALKYLTKLNPTFIDDQTLLLISNCYDSLGDKDNARYHLVYAAKRYPKNPYVHYNLGLINFSMNKIQESIENFNNAIKYNKKFGAAYYNAATCHYLQKDYKKAKKYYEKAIDLNLKNPDVYFNLALTYKMLENPKKATQYSKLYDNYKNTNKNIQ